MPQASDELRAKMNEYFGDPINDAGPHQFLLDNGWIEIDSGLWTKPNVTALDDIPQKEWDCLRFLMDEWDNGCDFPLIGVSRK